VKTGKYHHLIIVINSSAAAILYSGVQLNHTPTTLLPYRTETGKYYDVEVTAMRDLNGVVSSHSLVSFFSLFILLILLSRHHHCHELACLVSFG
jgi:hypothetical protein